VHVGLDKCWVDLLRHIRCFCLDRLIYLQKRLCEMNRR
jgi:hypothetical protein